MSMWTDQRVKALMARVDEHDKRIKALEGETHQMTAEELTLPPEQPHVDKRTKQYRETIGR